MKNLKFYTLLALLLIFGNLSTQAQVTEPVEILPSPTLIVYHMDQWSDNQIILNAVESGVGLYAVIIDEEGNIIDYELWHSYTNTCYFLTESKFFRMSDGGLCFYYVKGPDHPTVYKVSISEDFELTTFEFPDAFPFPEEITHDDWWNFAWLPNDDGSTFVSGVYIEGTHCVQMMVRYNEAGEITHQWSEITSRATTSLLPPESGASGCRLVMEDPDEVNSECVVFDNSLNVVDTKRSIYNQAVGIYRPHYEYFAVHPETDKVYLISDVSFPAFNGNPQIRSDIYMSQFNPDFTQTKFKLGPYTLDEYDQIALCEAIDFQGENIYMCGYMNTMFGGNAPDTDNFYVAMLDGNLNIVGEIYYHNEERMVVPYSIHVLESGDCLVSTAGKDRKTGEMQHAIFRVPKETFDGIEEAHDAGFAMAVAYPNPGKDVLNIRTGLQNAHVEIYDLSGKLIYNQEITENITSINTTDWSDGVYIWKIIVDGKIAESGKWIKE
ncbi:MAG: T9SS type A sorting domain-containing protein [Bacteroidales bacterium]|nr:T9SS type A sorting domain-containing protein [Bacteroidales bacterium]